MKTFKEYTTDDTLSPFFYQYGGSILGPGMGQYHPTADLNLRAQKEREVRKSDLDQLERYADRLFASLGIDVEFTKHFLDRVNDERNVKQITPSELTRLFKQTYKKHGKTIAKLGPDAEAVVNDMKTDINMPFVLNLKGGELELVAKTVMRKKDFKTSNPKLAFEEITERAKRAVAGGKVQKLVTAHGLTYKGKKYKEIDMELVSIDNSSQIVTFNIIHPREIFGNEVKLTFRNLRRGPYMATDTSKIDESKGFFTRGKSPEQKGKTLLRVMKSDLEKKLKGVPHSLSPDKTGTQIVIKVRPADVDKTKKLVGLPNMTKVVSEVGLVGVDEGRVRKTVKVGEDALVGEGKPHYALVLHREVVAIGTKQEMLELSDTQKGRVWLTKSSVGDIVEGIGEPNIFSQNNPRIPRKKGQPAGSKKHSDLYTDENPKGTIHGLGFKDVETARASVKKIEGSGKTHAHKIQAAIAMEQRARVMGKKAEAAIYRAYIEKMKKKTKEMRKEDAHGFKCPPGYKFDRKLMACVPKKTKFKTVYAYPYFFGGTKSGDQSGQAQSGQNGNGNGNGNGNAQGGNGNGGNGNGGNAGGGNGGGNGG